MAEMIRLRELAALFQPPKHPVVEAKTQAGDFEGINSVVQDALADLHDKLTEDGALASLADQVGMTELDKHKDKEGFTVLGRLDHLTTQYKKEVEKLMTEVELMFHSSLKEGVELTEMAASSKFTSGMVKSPKAKLLVKAFKAGEETYDMPNGESYEAKKTIPGNKLEKGQIVFASYSATNQGAQIYEILGFTGDEKKYGEGGVKFNSAKEMLAHYKVGSLKALEELQDKNEYGHHSYLVVKDLENGDEGPWFYIYKGRWASGSGAEALTFTLVEKI